LLQNSNDSNLEVTLNKVTFFYTVFKLLKSMRRLSIWLIIITTFFAVSMQAQIKLPAPSPLQTLKQEVGLGNIEIIYSRPGAKGRQVFGDLVPYGQLWRTGANEATRIIFSEPAEIGGKKIDSGSYVLYCIPNVDVWEIIFNKGLQNWGTEGYTENKDVVRLKIIPLKNKTSIETFTIQINELKTESCTIDLSWEKKIIRIPVNFSIKENIRQQLSKAMQSNKKPYWEAAQFYFEYDKNLTKALENINKALETNIKAYWMYLYKATIQKEMGDNAGALKSAEASLELATEANNEDYIRMNKKLKKELKK
jgi:hypothetical protein